MELSNRLKIFIYDLLKLNGESRYRLSFYSEKYPNYILSRFYFTEDEIELLLHMKNSEGLTFINYMDDLLSGGKGEVCSSHTIIPILYTLFNIKKNFDKDKKFINKMKKFKGLF